MPSGCSSTGRPVLAPGFVLTEDNADTVAAVCRRLDGVPLAIELAAARVRTLSPERIVAQLDDRFRLLTGGTRTLLPRQQTLLASVAWSETLLEDDERASLRRLGVFVGGFSLEAAEGLLGAFDDIDPYEVLDLISRLVDKSLGSRSTTTAVATGSSRRSARSRSPGSSTPARATLPATPTPGGRSPSSPSAPPGRLDPRAGVGRLSRRRMAEPRGRAGVDHRPARGALHAGGQASFAQFWLGAQSVADAITYGLDTGLLRRRYRQGRSSSRRPPSPRQPNRRSVGAHPLRRATAAVRPAVGATRRSELLHLHVHGWSPGGGREHPR